jgi:hypothetical protein
VKVTVYLALVDYISCDPRALSVNCHSPVKFHLLHSPQISCIRMALQPRHQQRKSRLCGIYTSRYSLHILHFITRFILLPPSLPGTDSNNANSSLCSGSYNSYTGTPSNRSPYETTYGARSNIVLPYTVVYHTHILALVYHFMVFANPSVLGLWPRWQGVLPWH